MQINDSLKVLLKEQEGSFLRTGVKILNAKWQFKSRQKQRLDVSPLIKKERMESVSFAEDIQTVE